MVLANTRGNDAEGLEVPAESLPSKKTGFRAYFCLSIIRMYRMKNINVILACICSLFLFTGCYTNILGDGIEPNPNPTPNTEIEEISIKCKLDVAEDYNTDGLTALTMAEKKESIDADFEISAIKNGIPQLLFIEDDDENVLMMSRGIYEKGQTVEINAETTTLALVTLHPMLGPITENYNELVQIIQTSEYYQPLYDEVKNCIENKKNIFDARNDQLMVALSNLLNNLCEDPSEYIQTTRASIATRSRLAVNSYPIHVSASGRTLTMKTIDLAPSYYGTVTTPSGTVKDLAVKSAGNYAGFNYILNNSSNLYGTPETFYFNTEGNYRFDLSRSNNQGLVDFYTNMVNGILQILGLRSDDLTKDLINALINQVRSAMEEDENANWIAMCKSVIEICGNVLYQEIIKDSGSSKIFAAITGIAKGVTWAIRLYDGFTGNANAMGMFAWWFKSPENINFCLCYNNGTIESCTETELNMVSGNNQIGEANQRLLLPIKVKVVTKNDNGVILPNIYQNIKFKVDNNKGAVSAELVGTDDEASVYWTLGDGNPGDVQKVTATVVDQITGEDISDPVEFAATLKKTSDITVRLDWHKLSGNTDIDLHVVDPFGEEIYYAHSSSQSGGWLDRDDVVGPGPEHIYWENAPAGTYKVKVHYYDSESMAVTTYKVTINANGESHTYSGSLAYHQEVTVASFTIPSTRAADTQGNNIIITPMSDVENNKVYPEKEKNSYILLKPVHLMINR